MPIRRITPSRAGFILATAAIVSVINMVVFSSMTDEKLSLDDETLEAFLSRPVPQDDPRLLEWVKKMMVPPSKEKYNLNYHFSGLIQESALHYSPSQNFILATIEKLLGDGILKGGTFLEAGAFDGEFLSNTLSLEKNYRWKGILVEPNSKFFRKLLTKNRKAWALNACLNTKPWPSKEFYVESAPESNISHFVNLGPSDDEAEKQTNLGSSGLQRYNKLHAKKLKVNRSFMVQCIPLYSVMRALGLIHIDFLSLDVEGAEIDILNTIPWSEASFSVIAVESKSMQEINDFLSLKGYLHVESHFADHIFVNQKDTTLH